MATTNEIYSLYLAYFGRPPDAVGFAAAQSKTPAQLQAEFSASAESSALLASTNLGTQVNNIYVNAFGRSAETAGLLYWVGEIAANRVTLSQAAFTIVSSALNDDRTTVTNKITAATAFYAQVVASPANIIGYSGNAASAQARTFLSSVTSSAATVTAAVAGAAAAVTSTVAAGSVAAVTPGSSFTLGVGADGRTGTAGNDTFDGSLSAGAQTLGSGDVLDGGAGNDTLFAVLTGSVTPARLTSIESVNFTANAGATLGLTNATGVTSVASTSAAGVVIVSGIAQTVAVTVADTAQNHTVTFTGVGGSADTASVNLRAVTGGTVTVAGIETLNLSNDGSATSGVTLTAANATRINVSGSGDINLTTASDTVATTVNASSATGALSFKSDAATAVTITGGSANDAITIVGGTAAKVNVDGGAGTDTITFTAALANGDTINGGEGTADTLVGISADLVGLTAQTPATISGLERVTVSNNLGGALTTANIQAGIERVNLAGQTGGNTVTFDAGSRTLSLAVAAGAAISVADTGTATTDTVTLLNGSAAANVYDTQAITATGFETVNLNTSTSTTRVTNQVNTIGITPDVGGSVTLNILGNNNFQSAAITATAATTSAKIDASGLTGTAFFKNTAATVGITAITGSANDDIIVGSATATTIDGGAGNDSITGGAANDSIVGGAGDDTLAAAAGTDVVDGGAGNDRVEIGSGQLTASDKYAGGDNTDTLAFSALVDADNDAGLLSGVSGFEVLEIAATASIALATSNFLNNQTFTRLDLGDLGDAKTLTLTNVAAGTNEVRLLAGAAKDSFSYDRLVDNSSGDTLTISARADLATGAVVKFTALDEETINISGSAAANNVTFTDFAVEDLTTLNITGAANVVVTNALTGATKLATVNASTSTAGVTINASTSTTAITATAGSGVFTFIGGALADTITGGAAADVLTGGSGADSITGGEGKDTVSGGLGKDSIVMTETVATADSVRFAEAGANNVDTVTGFAVTGTRDQIEYTIGNINNGGVTQTLSTAKGEDVNAAGAVSAETLAADGTLASANATNFVFLSATTATTFAEAIGGGKITNAGAAIDTGFATTAEGLAAVFYDLSAGQAVYGYIVNSSTVAADQLNSADTFVEVARVGVTAANYTAANINATAFFF